MTVEELLARRLRDHGVRRFFGIPGGPSIPYMEAFRREGIDFVLTSHEASAAVMADVTARLTGVTGVCHATFGPGATNLSTGVGSAMLDRTPLLALTSEMSDEWSGRTAQMNIDHQALFRPLTKATFRLTAGQADDMITGSLHIACDEYPGPVHLGLPAGLAGCSVSDMAKTASHSIERKRTHHFEDRIRVLYASSRRPLLAVGLTAMRNNAGAMLLEFLEKHRVPVVVTPMAKGIIPSDHPCYAGVLFHALSDRLKNLTREADLVIGLGYDPVEYNYEAWMPGVPLIHFDTVSSDLQIRGAIESVSLPVQWFKALSLLQSSPEMAALALQARNDIRNSLTDAASDFNAVEALSLLHDMMPANAIVTADVGSHLHLMGQMWDVPASGKLIMTNGWSSMGFALPAAIAAAIERPDLPVVCVTGDGGLLMHAGEMMTARRLGLKITVIVLSDGELNLIRVKQSWKGLKPYGTSLYRGSLFGSDAFLGTDVVHVTDSMSMRTAFGRAMTSRSSLIIEAGIDPSVYSELIVRP